MGEWFEERNLSAPVHKVGSVEKGRPLKMEAWKIPVSPRQEDDVMIDPHVLKALLEAVIIPTFRGSAGGETG